MAGISAPALAQDTTESDVDFEVYGFAQVDLIADVDGRMNPDWKDAFRPSRIATPEGQFGSDGETSFSVKQSRLGAKASGEAGGRTWEGKFEFDMFGVGSDAGKTAVRLRHAYGRWGPILGGQTNSLFMDGDIFPNVIDYWGPNGMVFLRTPQLRVTFIEDESITVAAALEYAGNDIDPGGIRLIDESISSSIKGKNELPDLTAAVRYGGDWGHVRLGGILRDISYETPGEPNSAPKGDELGWGLNGTGSFKLADMATFRGGIVYGEGIASYMNDGGMDLAPSASLVPRPIGPGQPIFPPPPPFLVLEAQAVPLLGFSTYFDLNWSKQLTSSVGYSQVEVDNTNFQNPDTFKRARYASANLLWSPIPRVLTGGEVLWGDRKNLDGTKGEAVRLQFSFKVSFSSKDLKM
ncbi:MAG: DcaP family trimeric outer membrane transporter [Novosphingobium sp.]